MSSCGANLSQGDQDRRCFCRRGHQVTHKHTPHFPKHTINMQQLIKAAEENIADTENFYQHNREILQHKEHC